MGFVNIFNAIRVKVREKLNPLLGKIRVKKLNNPNVTIISNNCWGGHVYRYFNLPYLSPTIGLYFYADDYIKFCKNLKHYINTELNFISIQQSKNSKTLIEGNKTCPIGVLDDIEVVFLHYRDQKQAKECWDRRKARINWENIVIKNSEQNYCNPELLKEFDQLSFDKKLCFVTKDYGLDSQVLWGGKISDNNIAIDTVRFRSEINIINWLNGKPYKKRQKRLKKKLSR